MCELSNNVLFILGVFLCCILLCVSFEGDKLAHKVLVDIHDCCVVVKVSAVVLG